MSHARGYGVLLLRHAQNEVKFLTYLRALRLIACWRIGGNEVLEFNAIKRTKLTKEKSKYVKHARAHKEKFLKLRRKSVIQK